MYKVDSPDAVDFINHQEIIETLEYARAHRNDRELIRNLIEKARLCKASPPPSERPPGSRHIAGMC